MLLSIILQYLMIVPFVIFIAFKMISFGLELQSQLYFLMQMQVGTNK